MDNSPYYIVQDEENKNSFYVMFLDHNDEHDHGFKVTITNDTFEINPQEGHEMIEYNPMNPYPLERNYTSDKHGRAHSELSGDICNKLIGGWNDLSGRIERDTDCDTLFKIHQHLFIVKRTKRKGDIIYRIRDINYREKIWFKYSVQ